MCNGRLRCALSAPFAGWLSCAGVKVQRDFRFDWASPFRKAFHDDANYHSSVSRWLGYRDSPILDACDVLSFMTICSCEARVPT